MSRILKPAVFLDRDGTLIDERGYLSDPNRIHFYLPVFAALRRLQKAGFKLVILTNQSGVGRGYFSLRQLGKINARFKSLLMKKGVRLDGIYFCPHHPEAGCKCRKPQPLMGIRAARDLSIDLKRSFMVGDQLGDMKLAAQLKVPAVLVLTGHGRSARSDAKGWATKVTRNMTTAADWILSHSLFR